MEPKTDGVALGPLVAPLPLGDYAIFLEELIGRLFEGGAGIEHADALLGRGGQEPVLGDLGGLLEGFLLRAELALPFADGGARLPEAAVVALVELKLSTQKIDGRHGNSSNKGFWAPYDDQIFS